jgi:hypothetical protein
MIAAPLKHVVHKTKEDGKVSFRDHMIAAPLKRGSAVLS